MIGWSLVRYSAGPAGPALAEAKMTIFAGNDLNGGTQCDPIDFSVDGHAEKPLLGNSFVRQMFELAGLKR